MFKSSKPPALAPSTDFTGTLRETSFYKFGHLRQLGLTGEVTALAVDPLLSLMAVGTAAGMVHVYGTQSFQFSLPVCAPLPGSGKKPDSIKFLVFHPGHNRLVAIDSGNMLHAFTLNQISESATPNVSPPLPTREANYILFGEVRAVEQPLPSYTHMFITMRDGVILAWDLRQRAMSSFNVPNLWAIHEERLVRSGVPGRRKTIGGPQATCSAINPRDLNILLVGYEGGVVAWNFQKGVIDKCFEMTLPPGATGGGTYDDTASLWTERTPAVTSIAWRPDGLVFAVGHVDGCITFWAYEDPDKPLTVRTLTHEDVNVTDAESLMEAGVLGGKPRTQKEFEGMPVLPASIANREPIYKLTWAGFPNQAELKLLATQTEGTPVTNATAEYAERGETLLIVLGGQSHGEKPGINMLQLPAYQPPLPGKTKATSSPSEGLSAPLRSAFRDSLYPTGSSSYATKTPPEDFILLPRSSPYFAMAYDPIAIFILLTPDIRLPNPGASAERQLDGYAFPPPRSSAPPPVLGRKNYATPGDGEKVMAFTPAPMRQTTAPNRSSSNSSWRFPWSASPVGDGHEIPSIGTPTTASFLLGNPRRKLRLPSQIWSGGLTALGANILPLPTPTFMRLISTSVENAAAYTAARVPLRGGLSVPDLQSHGAPDLKVIKMENYRLLVTWHADCTVRFWDISPHILVLPTPLRFEYPNPLPYLTINIGEWLRRRELAHLPLAKLWAADRSKVQIAGVYLARESLECVITFVSGEVIVTKFGEAKEDTPSDFSPLPEEDDADREEREGYFPQEAPPDHDHIDEITEIDELAQWGSDGFKPVAIFTVKRGPVVSCAVSDIGFIAVAFAQHSLAILDMRGPDVILREGFDEDGKTKKRRKRKDNVQNMPSENSLVGTMKWVISGMGGDSSPRPRLIVSYVKGTTKIYGLTNVLGEWMVEQRPPTFANESLVNPLATYLIDPATGDELLASPSALADVIESGGGPEGKWTKEAPPHCLWIAASKHTIRCSVNINGERVAKVEFEQEELSDVHYVTRHGHRVIVALTTTGSAIVYSAPFLEFITRMDLFFGGEPRSIGRLSFDDRSGDFVEYNGPLDIALRTLFHFRKPFPPRIDPCTLKTPTPSQPTPVTASSLGWMWGAGPLTGAALDTLVGGPNRPTPPKPPAPPKKPLLSWGTEPLITWGDAPKDATPPPKAPSPTAPKRPAVRRQHAPTADVRERNDAYSQLQHSLHRRNDYLDRLNESINTVAEATQNYVNAATKTAYKETAKAGSRAAFAKLV